MAAPTLIVGLGGKGIQIVELIAQRAQREEITDVEFVVMDTDVNDLRRVRQHNPNIHTIQTSPKGTVGAALDTNSEARDNWFPLNAGLMGKPFTEGAGQVRAVSRLAFDHAIEQNHMRELEVAIQNLRGISGNILRQEMRVMITGSVAGGTGSGILLPVAMYIRNYLITRYQDDSAIIRGFFLQPDTLFDVIKDEDERNSLRCNAYATIRELDAFFRKEYSGESKEFSHVVFNAPQPGTTERMDYPNILPYHFVFLMDAVNAQGERLPNAQAYVDHIADVIFAQTLSPASAKSNSAEDNVIRMLSGSKGRSRYCGAGCSYLEYPKEAVQRYIGLKWASNSITGEWMEIDDDYLKLEREGKAGDRDVHYRNFFETKVDKNAFYHNVARGTTSKIKSANKGEGTREEPVSEKYLRRLLAHIVSWNDSYKGLAAKCDELRIFEDEYEHVVKHAPDTTAAIDAMVENSGGDAEDLEGIYQDMYRYVERYFSIISDSVGRSTRLAAEAEFAISEYDENPLTSRTEEWFIEPHIYNKSEILHPSGVRYLLSCISLLLQEEVDKAESESEGLREAIQKALNEDYLGETDERENPGEAVAQLLGDDDDDGKGPVKAIKGLFSRGLDEDAKGRIAAIGSKLNKLAKNLDEYRQCIVTGEFCKTVLAYVSNLNRAYVEFYRYLGAQINSLESEVESIHRSDEFNADRGITRRYVCASTACLDKIEQECPPRGDSSEIDPDLCGDIYRGLLRFTMLFDTVEEQRELTAAEKKRAFGRLYERTIKDFWISRVVDPSAGYPTVVDKDIIQAILDEARYTYPNEANDPDKRQAFLESRLERAFEQAAHIATPFIEAPVGEQPRHISLCTYSGSLWGKQQSKMVGQKLKDVLSSHNGAELPEGTFSEYVIMFYSSLYGFCATNLPKFAPEHAGMQRRPEGEYHRVYWNNVKQLSPDLSANRLITPHIDKNWHLISYLPDLNDDYETQLKNDITRAYIYGIAHKQFAEDEGNNNTHLFHLTTRRGSSRVDLMVSNGTHCDKFYEVFDALKFSPLVVYELLGRSDRSLKDELEENPGVENCNLVKKVKSQAFASHIMEDDVIACIDAYMNDAKALCGSEKLSKRDADDFLADMVSSMFSIDVDEGGDSTRRSLFEIPVFYKISLPHSDERVGEIESMVDGILTTTHDYFANFCDPDSLESMCEQFFVEQLLRFEYNLVRLDQQFPGCATDRTANTVREKVISFFSMSSELGDQIWESKNRIDKKWKVLRRAQRELERKRVSGE